MGRDDSSEFVIVCWVGGERARSCRVSGRALCSAQLVRAAQHCNGSARRAREMALCRAGGAGAALGAVGRKGCSDSVRAGLVKQPVLVSEGPERQGALVNEVAIHDQGPAVRAHA
jgi:hypothetical protein